MDMYTLSERRMPGFAEDTRGFEVSYDLRCDRPVPPDKCAGTGASVSSSVTVGAAWACTPCCSSFPGPSSTSSPAGCANSCENRAARTCPINACQHQRLCRMSDRRRFRHGLASCLTENIEQRKQHQSPSSLASGRSRGMHSIHAGV